MNRKQLILIGLLGLLVICVFYAFWATPRQERVSSRPGAARLTVTAGGDVQARPKDESTLHLDLLAVEDGAYAEPKRDIFSFHVRKPAIKPVPKPEPVAPAPPPVVAPPVMPTPPAAPMQRALANFVFLGLMKKGEEKTIFLSGAGEVFLAKKDQTFGKNQEFKVLEITETEMTVSRTGQTGTMTVKLAENQNLSPVISAPARTQPSGGPEPARPVLQQPGSKLQRRAPVRFRPSRPTGSTPEPGIENILEPPEEGDDIEGGPDGSNQ